MSAFATPISVTPLLAASLLALVSIHPAAGATRVVAVEAVGSVPGIPDPKLSAYLADEMNSAGSGPWRFEPAAAGTTAPNRVQWNFKNLSSAVGAVRSYGFARSIVQRLLGVRHYMSVEATLYLDGDYQTQSLIELTTTGGTQDSVLAAEITNGTKRLMAYPSLSDDNPSAGTAKPSHS